MPLPPPKRIDDLFIVVPADTCALLEECKQKYKEFKKAIADSKRAGEFKRISRDEFDALVSWNMTMKAQIYALEIAVTEQSN